MLTVRTVRLYLVRYTVHSTDLSRVLCTVSDLRTSQTDESCRLPEASCRCAKLPFVRKELC